MDKGKHRVEAVGMRSKAPPLLVGVKEPPRRQEALVSPLLTRDAGILVHNMGHVQGTCQRELFEGRNTLHVQGTDWSNTRHVEVDMSHVDHEELERRDRDEREVERRNGPVELRMDHGGRHEEELRVELHDVELHDVELHEEELHSGHKMEQYSVREHVGGTDHVRMAHVRKNHVQAGLFVVRTILPAGRAIA